ncbi:MAG TPA: hypothetical protein VFA12_03445 [Stellaceae bacterium]|nr:hypothetical protein [Stellaceae bacterium]
MSASALDPLTVAGIVGAAVLVAAYFANQQRWLRSEHFLYPLLNLIGSGLILISLFSAWNLPSVVIEVFWIGISVIGLFRTVNSRL